VDQLLHKAELAEKKSIAAEAKAAADAKTEAEAKAAADAKAAAEERQRFVMVIQTIKIFRASKRVAVLKALLGKSSD
jgi:hypothetical protein